MWQLKLIKKFHSSATRGTPLSHVWLAATMFDSEDLGRVPQSRSSWAAGSWEQTFACGW